MLFFPTAYPDELLFSLCSRYYVRSGNISYKEALDDLFSKRSLTTSITLPSGISSLVKNLPPYSKIDEQQLIYGHTLYLFYTAFSPLERAKKIYEAMCSSDGMGIYGLSGITASKVPQNEYLRYCPECMKEDKEKYGEYYWHRSHQISGIQCCLTHYRPLNDSRIRVVGSNKHRFQISTLENCSTDKSVLDGVSEKTLRDYINFCRKIAKSLFQLMSKPYSHRKVEEIHEIYQRKLIGLALAYYTGKVKQKKWRAYFSSIYSQELLQLCFSPLIGEQDWLSLIVQKNRKAFHPIRHLLVLAALGMEVEEVMECDNAPQPFGHPMWPCLNPVCEYYQLPVIEQISITLADKSKEPIGTFTCPACRFSYTRRGPDQNEEDKYRKTRVKEYGDLWIEKLEEYSKQGIGLRELSRKMRADPNTIKRYLYYQNPSVSQVVTNNSSEDCRHWQLLRKRYPNKSVKQLREAEKALYMRLYRKDREWLKNNSPKPIMKSSKVRIDWKKRDQELLSKVKNAVEELLSMDKKPLRVTVGRVGYLISEKALLEKKLNKLLRTKEYLQQKVESVEQFQERRILYTIHQSKLQGEEMVAWRILRKAGIKDYGKWLEFVESHLDKDAQ